MLGQDAPCDILTSNTRKAAIQANRGLAYSAMTQEQRGMLLALIEEYASVMPQPLARERLEKVRGAGLDAVTFAWMGGLERGLPHYYRVQGPTFLIEYDCTQNDANHIHAVWRDFKGDFGVDLLTEHHRNSPHHGGAGGAVQPGANALLTAEGVRPRMADLARSFPKGIEWRVPYDTTVFVNASIELVVHTFIEAFVLVLVVVYLFLGSLRATLIPLLAIPVSIIGTFAGMLLMGFSLNMLTLFGLVLAIGIVVDDAIVVVEAVEKIMHDEKLPPREAAMKAMQGIGGAIVGVTAVICAVFVPIAFLGGVTGTLYKQFAVTITISTLLSALTALTLTPALCGLILKEGAHKRRRSAMATPRRLAASASATRH